MKLIREYFELRPDAKMLNEYREAEKEGRPIVLSGKIQSANQKNGNGRIYPRDILEPKLEEYVNEFVKRGTALGECVDDQTEIYTTSGWKYVKDISENEEIYTLQTESNSINIEKIKRKVDLPFSGKLLHFSNGKKMDMMLTPNHNVLLWDRHGKSYKVTAEELKNKLKENDSKVNHSKLRKSGDWKSDVNENSTYTIPGTEYSMPLNVFAGFFGIWLAEGHVSNSKAKNEHNTKYQVGISQKKEEEIKLIENLLKQTTIPFKKNVGKDGYVQFLINNKNLHIFFSEFGNSKEKFIPKEYLNWPSNTLKEMLHWMLLGDGRNRTSPKGELIKEYCSISTRLAQCVSELFFKIGLGSQIHTWQTKDVTIEGRFIPKENCNELHIVSENKSNSYMDARFVSTEEVDYNGRVYCVTTNNGNWLMKRNNFVAWTGNCDHTEKPVVELKNVSHIMREIWWDGDDVHGKIELLPTPAGEIAKSLVRSGIPLGISSRAVGSVSHNEASGIDYVGKDLQIITFDLVSSPSTSGAYLALHEVKNFNKSKILPPKYRILEHLKEILKK